MNHSVIVTLLIHIIWMVKKVKIIRTGSGIMKKLLGIISILVIAIFLTACGESEETRTFELENNGITTTMVYTYSGDKVKKQTAENVIQYEVAGIASKEEAQQMFDPLIKEFQNIDGLTHKMEYEESKAIETLAIDFEKVNFKEIENLPGMNFTENPTDKGISMKKSAEMLESQGFTEVQ